MLFKEYLPVPHPDTQVVLVASKLPELQEMQSVSRGPSQVWQELWQGSQILVVVFPNWPMGQLERQVWEELSRNRVSPFTDNPQEVQLGEVEEQVLQFTLQGRQLWLPEGAYWPSGHPARQVPN